MIPSTPFYLTVIYHKAILRLCCLPAGMIGLFSTPLPAQQDSITQVPITQIRAPDVSRWEVIIQHRDTPEVAALEEARSGPRLTSEVIEKDKTFYRVLRRYSDSKQDEFWVTPHIQFHRPAGKSEVIRLLPGDGSAVDFSESDFQELYWAVGRDARRVRSDGRDFLLVEAQGSALPLTRREQKDADRMAEFMRIFGDGQEASVMREPQRGTFRLYLDARSRLPVRFESPGALHLYRFSSHDGLANAMPRDFTVAMREWQQEFSQAARPPSAPKIRNPNAAR